MAYKRYANPSFLLNEYIKLGRFEEFVAELDEIRHKEIEDDTLWQFYLHKVFNVSYSEFKNANNIHEIEAKQQEIDFGTTIQDSYNILQNFHPDG